MTAVRICAASEIELTSAVRVVIDELRRYAHETFPDWVVHDRLV